MIGREVKPAIRVEHKGSRAGAHLRTQAPEVTPHEPVVAASRARGAAELPRGVPSKSTASVPATDLSSYRPVNRPTEATRTMAPQHRGSWKTSYRSIYYRQAPEPADPVLQRGKVALL